MAQALNRIEQAATAAEKRLAALRKQQAELAAELKAAEKAEAERKRELQKRQTQALGAIAQKYGYTAETLEAALAELATQATPAPATY